MSKALPETFTFTVPCSDHDGDFYAKTLIDGIIHVTWDGDVGGVDYQASTVKRYISEGTWIIKEDNGKTPVKILQAEGDYVHHKVGKDGFIYTLAVAEEETVAIIARSKDGNIYLLWEGEPKYAGKIFNVYLE